MDSARPGARSRAARTAAVALGLALLAHLAAGGHLELRGLTFALVAVSGLAGLAALRRPGAVTAAAGLGVLQLGVHVTAASTSAAAGHDRLTFLCGAGGGSGHVTPAHLAAMIATHLSATALGAWWLARGDRLALGLVGELRSVVRALLAPPAIPIPARERAAAEEARLHCTTRAGSVAGRAPPLGSWF